MPVDLKMDKDPIGWITSVTLTITEVDQYVTGQHFLMLDSFMLVE